ncbi:TNFAIP3-interacting protein 3-like [Sparus aurata]|uniref:TNFAIP3-interacting protein 3-like n=1 Tax=Sparus aurata TaxID=8175 RepID=UPI0011C18D94|nr:TNFAIP3-interacting protein 3-like [Sparus aurata]
MSLHENTTDRSPVERSQAGESVRKLTYRLYPSLPNVDGYDICVADPSSGETLCTAAVHRPDPQSEAASADVRLKAQILILEEQRRELLSINEKWAKEYRTMTQYYKNKVQNLKALRQHCAHCEEETCEDREKITLNKKVKDKESTQTTDADVSSEVLKAENETKELLAQNRSLTRRWEHQHAEIRRLNKALDEALQTAQPLEASRETLHEVWKHQAEVYKEDFLKERKDREKLKEKYLELEKKYRKVHSELRGLKPQVVKTRPPQPAPECTCTNRDKCPDWEDRPVNQHHMQLHRR